MARRACDGSVAREGFFVKQFVAETDAFLDQRIVSRQTWNRKHPAHLKPEWRKLLGQIQRFSRHVLRGVGRLEKLADAKGSRQIRANSRSDRITVARMCRGPILYKRQH